MMPSEKNRLQIALSASLERRITLYSRAYEKPKATMVTHLLEEILEQKAEVIERLVEETARAERISAEELMKRWLSEES
jgi:hypothetical protein